MSILESKNQTYDFYIQRLITELDGQVSPDLIQRLTSPNLISNHQITLRKEILTQAQEIIMSFYQYFNGEAKTEKTIGGFTSPGYSPTLNSFDFHLDASGKQLKLIEINTNASLSYMSYLLYDLKNTDHPYTDFKTQVFSSFLEPLGSQLKKIIIIDDKPLEQKLFIEFKLFQNLFNENGLDCEIQDTADLGQIDADTLIYNRDTDFMLTQPRSKNLLRAVNSGVGQIQPHPFHYQQYADKKRLMDIGRKLESNTHLQPDAIKSMQEAILKTHVIDEKNREEIWKNRKSYFMKPINSFGSKAVYKGESISHTLFNSFTPRTMIAQEFVPAPVYITDSGSKFKYDLRFITYKHQILIAFARAYQGQLTNMRTIGGGIARLKFTS